MARTPGVIIPPFYSSQKALEDDLHRRDSEAGYMPLNPADFIQHSDVLVDFLEHHGVKGMHWGIRNKKPKNRVKKSSSDHKKTAPLRKKKVHELTNKQLQSANSRANLERNFRSLNPTAIERGHAAVKGILSIAGTAASVAALLNTPAGKALISSGKSFFEKRF